MEGLATVPHSAPSWNSLQSQTSTAGTPGGYCSQLTFSLYSVSFLLQLRTIPAYKWYSGPCPTEPRQSGQFDSAILQRKLSSQVTLGRVKLTGDIFSRQQLTTFNELNVLKTACLMLITFVVRLSITHRNSNSNVLLSSPHSL